MEEEWRYPTDAELVEWQGARWATDGWGVWRQGVIPPRPAEKWIARNPPPRRGPGPPAHCITGALAATTATFARASADIERLGDALAKGVVYTSTDTTITIEGAGYTLTSHDPFTGGPERALHPTAPDGWESTIEITPDWRSRKFFRKLSGIPRDRSARKRRQARRRKRGWG